MKKEQLHCPACGKHFEVEAVDAPLRAMGPGGDEGSALIRFGAPGEVRVLWVSVCVECGRAAAAAAGDMIARTFILEMLGWLCRIAGDVREYLVAARTRVNASLAQEEQRCARCEAPAAAGELKKYIVTNEYSILLCLVCWHKTTVEARATGSDPL